MKKLIVAITIIIVVIIGIILGNSEKFFGQIVFFKSGAVKEKVIEGSYLNVKDAFLLLTNAATKTGITNKDAMKKLTKELDSISEEQITRAQFADLAAEIFGIKNYGYGVNFSDVPKTHTLSKSIYLFTSNGAIDAEFKPENPATRAFGEKAAENLAKRFAK